MLLKKQKIKIDIMLGLLAYVLGVSITLSLDDDVFEEVKKYAKSRDVALGKAVSELVRRGVDAPVRNRVVNGFHVVDLPTGAPTLNDSRTNGESRLLVGRECSRPDGLAHSPGLGLAIYHGGKFATLDQSIVTLLGDKDQQREFVEHI